MKGEEIKPKEVLIKANVYVTSFEYIASKFMLHAVGIFLVAFFVSTLYSKDISSYDFIAILSLIIGVLALRASGGVVYGQKIVRRNRG